MTSAQNHLPLLNGNKTIIWFLSFCLFLSISSCIPTKTTTGGNDKPDELDPVTGNNKDNVNDNPDIVREVSKPETPDTISWIPIGGNDGNNGGIDPIDPDGGTKDPDDPNNGGNTGDDVIIPTGTTKIIYEVAVLLPLYTDEFNSSGSVPKSTGATRSLNFYEGILLGLRRLEAEGARMNVQVYDTRVNSISSLLTKDEIKNADFIFGPVSKSKVIEMAMFAKTNNNIILSLNSSEGLTSENPYYIQSSPSFSTHCEEVIEYVKNNYSNGNVVLLGRGDEASFFGNYQSANSMINGSSTLINEYLVNGSNVNYDIRSISDYLSKTDTNVVIIPSTNPNFVKSMLRDLSLIRRTYPMVVFGLPAWASERFAKIEPDYFEKLHVHITTSTYINAQDPNIQTFKVDFYNEYGMPPSNEAYKGYDLALYFGRMLKNHGTNLLTQLEASPDKMLHSSLHFKPIYAPNLTMGEGSLKVNQFENRYVNVLRFSNYQFLKVND